MNMISDQAKQGFEHIFKNAILTNLTHGSDGCDIRECQVAEFAKEKSRFAVLTVSSASFRCLVIFHFQNEQLMRDLFADKAQDNAPENRESVYRDAFLEFCNMCCGSVNREILRFYPYLGMSTPYLLVSDCHEFIGALRPGHVKHYAVRIDGRILFGATLCVCAYSSIDFKLDAGSLDSGDSGGELELF